MYYKFDEGEKVYCQPFIIKGVACSFSDKDIEDIEDMIWEILEDKAFDDICWFERKEEK